MRSRRVVTFSLLLILAFAFLTAEAQPTIRYKVRKTVIDGEATVEVDIPPVYVFPKPVDLRRYGRMVENLKAVYPIAIEARETLRVMEERLAEIPSRRDQEAFVKEMEKFLKRKYTPVLRKMTYSQGKILIKLIDRETNRTSYDLLKELRGSFSAVFWQGVARIFGANLKESYDKDGEDWMIERLILLYEAGQL